MVDDMASRGKKRRKDPRKKPEITRWKRWLLLGAIVFVALGIGLRVAAGRGAEPGAGATRSGAGDAGPAGSSLVDSGAPASGLAASSSSAAEPTPGESGASGWSPFFLKNGFSFLAAFCLGYAARVWLGITFTVLGTILLAVFALSYFDVITVDWSTIGDVGGGLARRLGEELSDFRGFVTGSLPQAGSASVGLVAGFKMR